MRKRKMLIICMAVVMIFTACEPMSTKEERNREQKQEKDR